MKVPSFLLKAGQYQAEKHGLKYRTCLTLLPLRGRNGYIFGLTKVEKKHAKDLRNICRTISGQANRLAPGLENQANPQHTFEQFLANLNQELSEQIKAGAWNLPIEDLNSLVGLACEQEMYLSGVGELTALFLHKTENEHYQIFNLSRNLNNEQAALTWEKTFSVILDGDLAAGDIFCLCSEPCQPTISKDELHEVLTTLPAEGAAEKIQQYFPHDSALSVLVVKAQSSQAVSSAAGAPALSSPHRSIEHLESTRSETGKILKDQKPAGLISLAKQLLAKSQNSARQINFRKKLINLFKKILFGMIRHRLMRKIKGRLQARQSAKERVEEAKQRAVHALDGMRPKKNKFPGSAKYLLLAAFSILIMLSIGIYLLNQDNEESQEIANWQTQIQEINSLIEQGAAAIIYKDENQARNFYSQAQEQLNQISAVTPEQEAERQKIQNEIKAAMDQLRHIINIPDPPLIADFSAFEDFIRAQTFSFYNQQLFIFTNNKEVYRANLTDKALEPLQTADGSIGIPLASAADEENLLILDNRPGISRFNPENMALQITEQAPAEDTKWADIELYGDKLYILQIDNQTNDGQIMRLARSGSGFASPAQWIKSKSTNLQNAVGLSIDGTIFVLKDDGTIIRFARSSQVGWEADKIEPPITKAAKIWTDVDSDYIYVLEPLGKRVIVYQKENGKFLAQYYMESLNNLKDFQINETSQKIYLLTDQGLYSINMSHE